ncbi:MAG: hypothetical protein NTX33_00075 [Propionibacteriales bacterium]|nr:hypothetical protein [Propionibacteriales bacterium]
MSNLEKATASGVAHRRAVSRGERALDLAVGEIRAETKLAAVKVDASAALAGRIMERVVDIDEYRRALAGNDETLNAALTRIELGFIAKAERIQRGMGSEFGL